MTDSHVAPLYLEEVLKELSKTGMMVASYIIPAGEVNKNLEQIQGIYEYLIQNHFDRKDMLVALEMCIRDRYEALADYLTEALNDDKGFSKLLYKYMLHEDTISGAQLCMLLYDQGVLEPDEAAYKGLESGTKRAYDFMIQKISNLEITPAQLALDPCSGSVVITDVNTGETLACVTSVSYTHLDPQVYSVPIILLRLGLDPLCWKEDRMQICV